MWNPDRLQASGFKRPIAFEESLARSLVLARVLACAGLLSALVGCVGEGGVDPEATESTTRAVGYLNGIKGKMWPRGSNNRYSIPVCFRQGTLNSGSSPTWSTDKTQAFSALTSTWGSAAPIDFTNQGDCPTSPANNVIPVTLVYDSSNGDAWGGVAVTGQGSRINPCQGTGVGPNCTGCSSACQVRVAYGSNKVQFRDDFTHEVGHVLGLMDGHLRADFPSPGSCNGYSWQAYTPDPNTTYLTAKPDFASIMSDRAASCFKLPLVDNYGISDGDKLGISILYPWAINAGAGSIGSTLGMYTSSGVVIRAEGSATTAWYARGADPGLFNGGPTWRVKVGSTWVGAGTGLTVGASAMATGSNQVSFSFTDDFGRALTGVDSVIKNPALHTALVKSAASILL